MSSLATASIGFGEARPSQVELKAVGSKKVDASKQAQRLFSKKKKHSKSFVLRKKLNRILNHYITTIVLSLMSFYLIFIDDIVVASGGDNTYSLVTGIGTIQVIIFFAFLFEIIVNSFVLRKEYIISPLIILDLLALISMIPDLLVFLFNVQGLANLHALGITRAARAARVATRLTRIPRVMEMLSRPKDGVDKSAGVEPSKVGRKLVARLIITVICLLMILLLAATLCTPSPDFTPHAQVALSELHRVGVNEGVNSANFNSTLNTYISSYGSDISVLYVKVIDTEVVNNQHAIAIAQPTYLVQFDGLDGGSSTAILSLKATQMYEAGLSIVLSWVVIILLIGGSFLITRDASVMVIQPLEKMLALIKKMTTMSRPAASAETTYTSSSHYDDDDDAYGDVEENESSVFDDDLIESDSEDPDLETEVLVSMLDQLTQEHEEEEYKKREQQEIIQTIAAIQSGTKAWIARKRYLERKKLAKRAQMVAAEILSTEKSYVNGLNICVTQFLAPLRNSTLIAPDKLEIVFSNIEQICEYNKELLVKLDARISKWAPNQVVGDIFVDLSKDVLDIYTGFVNNYNDAIECVKNTRTSDEKFDKFLLDRFASPECNSLDIQSYLIMPVQRVPRYVMLLDQLIKFTPPDHQDYEQLEEAFKLMKQVTVAMNERKRDAENQFTVQEVLMRMDVPIDILMEPKVALVLTADFKHEGDHYLCYLFSNCFVQTKEKHEGLAVKGVIPFGALKLSSVCDSPQFGLFNAIQVEGADVGPLLLTCKTPEQKKEWVDGFAAQIAALRALSKARTQTNVKNSPSLRRDKSTSSMVSASPPSTPKMRPSGI